MYCTHIYIISTCVCIYIWNIYICLYIHKKHQIHSICPATKVFQCQTQTYGCLWKKSETYNGIWLTSWFWCPIFSNVQKPVSSAFFWLVNRIPYATPWHGDNPQLMLASIISQQIINHHWYVHQFSPRVWWLKRLKPLLHKWLLWH